LIGRALSPAATVVEMVVRNEKMPSPATRSPLVPSSKKDRAAESPIDVRLTVALPPVVGAPAQINGCTVNNVELPAAVRNGFAIPRTAAIPALTRVVLFRGWGVKVAKSAMLLSESVLPPQARAMARLLAGAGALFAAVPPSGSRQFAEEPYPTKSTIPLDANGGQAPESAV